ncbi:hypothetical protein GOV10_06545 [Candidatus Woesearchaeota archaeon]|nr:hypothetical protein [Candidatus Woesearchaeota archaeon]
MFQKFLKKLFRHKSPSREQEKLSLKNVGTWLDKRGKNIKENEELLYSSIKDHVKDMISELDERLIVLKAVDYESLKAEPRLKAMVRGNLKKYISHINLLQESVCELDKSSLGEFVAETKSVLNDFFQKSNMNYQKTTILIGNELADVHKSVTKFAKFLDKTTKSNGEIIDASQTIYLLGQKVAQIDDFEKNIDKIEKTTSVLKGKKRKLSEKIAKLIEETEKIKRGKTYAENMKKAAALRQNEKNLKRAIHELRASIDFKALGNKIHSNKKEMNILRAHKNNFQEAFAKDNGMAISKLLADAGIDGGVSEKIQHIKILKDKTGTISYVDDTKNLLAKQKLLQAEINEVKKNMVMEHKRQERLKAQRESAIDHLIKEFAEIDVSLRR